MRLFGGQIFFLLPHGGLELLVVHVAPAVDLLALMESSPAADHGGEVELDGAAGNIDDVLAAEELVDALLNLIQSGESLGVDLADELLGAVALILERSLGDQRGDVLDGAAVTTALATAPATTTLVGSQEETESSEGLDTKSSDQEATSADANATREDGVVLGHEGSEDQEESGDDGELHC